MCQIVEDPDRAADNKDEEDEDPSIAIEIVVSDTGCGMAPEEMEQIYRQMQALEVRVPHASKDEEV